MISVPKTKEGIGLSDGETGADADPKKQNRFRNSGGALLSDMPNVSSCSSSLEGGGDAGVGVTGPDEGDDSCLLKPSASLIDLFKPTDDLA